jgi:hypothetical protein
MYAQPVENAPGSPPAATASEPSQRILNWARVRELGEAIAADGDPAAIIERAREPVDVLRGPE